MSKYPASSGSGPQTGSFHCLLVQAKRQTASSKTLPPRGRRQTEEAMQAAGRADGQQQPAAGQANGQNLEAALVQLAVQAAAWQQRELQLRETVVSERVAFLESVVQPDR